MMVILLKLLEWLIWPWGCFLLYHMTNFKQNDWPEAMVQKQDFKQVPL